MDFQIKIETLNSTLWQPG